MAARRGAPTVNAPVLDWVRFYAGHFLKIDVIFMSVCLATGNERNTDPAEAAEAVPGGVYLCQVSETVSCGACCGLYNVADPSRTALQTMLAKRTARFVRLPRNMDAILDFAVRTESEFKTRLTTRRVPPWEGATRGWTGAD